MSKNPLVACYYYSRQYKGYVVQITDLYDKSYKVDELYKDQSSAKTIVDLVHCGRYVPKSGSKGPYSAD